MSALRTPTGYVDPYTHRPYVPPVLVDDPPAPVFRRKATPDELARLDVPDAMPRIIDAIGLVPRPIRGRYTDAERREREGRSRFSDAAIVGALAETGGHVGRAAVLLDVPESTMYRWVHKIRERGVL